MKNTIRIVDRSFFHKMGCKDTECDGGCRNFDYKLSAFNATSLDEFKVADLSYAFFKNKKLHRLDGPAIQWDDGCYVWCKDGKLHREDGPACYWPLNSKTEEWFYEGEYIDVETNKQFLSWVKLRVFI